MKANPSNGLTRRQFLQLGGLAALSLAARPLRRGTGVKFGRVVDKTLSAYDQPAFSAATARQFSLDDILPIVRTVQGPEGPAHNADWHEIEGGGYVHSGLLQPVDFLLNEPVDGLSVNGQLAEVTVPYTDAYALFTKSGAPAYRYYFHSTHWVNALIIDERTLTAWYRVMDDKFDHRTYFVQAEHLRLLPERELSPISPDVPLRDKRLEVRIQDQLVIAYEYGDPVLLAQVATGDEAANPNWRTPVGSFQTYYKRASRHMIAGNLALGNYDLPGVPWVCYFTNLGHAFHGTYWHNDFGRPRSHGCVNLKPDDARWLFRWTMPAVPPERQLKYDFEGTWVDIVA
ncbi:MAG: murein L,D-transpeptidase [Anaerolineae bacterium]|nr:MAG: murein L,D-transpeptidase [Anaerolineae bacterium]